MHLYLINPRSSLSGITRIRENHWNKYRVWKPLGLLTVAGLTPPEWHVTILDENLATPDYAAMPRPDLVGITAFTSQATRAYEVASEFRKRRVPVVMGGIHASMCSGEALERVDAVVIGEAEGIWGQLMEDVRKGVLNRVYEGVSGELDRVPPARQELLSEGYRFGAIQTARGCPVNCSFCSVTAFNGPQRRERPIAEVVREFKSIREKYILIVDDNLIGTRTQHIARAKELFRAMIRANLQKKWFAQATINMGDDEELIRLAARAGCVGVFIGFESMTVEGLAEVNKKFNLARARDLRNSIRRIHERGILIVGSYIIGLDVDKVGVGLDIADTADHLGLDLLNVLILTPLPGTRLWEKMESEGRIAASVFPDDWKYYTLTFPVATYKHMTWVEVLGEMEICFRTFYSYSRVVKRLLTNLWCMREPFWSAVSHFCVISNALGFYRKRYSAMDVSRGASQSGM